MQQDNLHKWKKGDSLSADLLNELRDATLRNITGGAGVNVSRVGSNIAISSTGNKIIPPQRGPELFYNATGLSRTFGWIIDVYEMYNLPGTASGSGTGSGATLDNENIYNGVNPRKAGVESIAVVDSSNVAAGEIGNCWTSGVHYVKISNPQIGTISPGDRLVAAMSGMALKCDTGNILCIATPDVWFGDTHRLDLVLANINVGFSSAVNVVQAIRHSPAVIDFTTGFSLLYSNDTGTVTVGLT